MSDAQRSKDCLSCRIISGITLTCAGLFIGYHGYRFKGYSQGGMLAIATGTKKDCLQLMLHINLLKLF
jgi:hypothetical protein